MTIPSIYFQDLSIYLIDQPLIGYRFNPNSTTSIHNVSHTNDMYEYYVSLEKLDETIPREILKIKIARSIAYFFNELQSEDIPITEVMDDINKVSKRFDLLKTLKLPDLFFFIFPKTYMIIDRFRLKRQKVKNED